MLHVREFHDLGELNTRLRDAGAADAALANEVISAACRRYPSLGQTEKTMRLEQLIRSAAWTDVALALIDLELPMWQYGVSPMTRVNGIAPCRASASCPTGSTDPSRLTMPICRWRF